MQLHSVFVFIHEHFIRSLFVCFVRPVQHEIKQYTISFIVIVLFYNLHLTNKINYVPSSALRGNPNCKLKTHTGHREEPFLCGPALYGRHNHSLTPLQLNTVDRPIF